MRSIRAAPALANIPVLVRGALNVPLGQGTVANEYRLRRAVETLRFLSGHGARTILISHLGERGTETLAPVAEALSKLIHGVTFCPETIGPRVRAIIRDLLPGKILVLENLRRNRGEVMNDPTFAAELASLGDVFVQDSFDTCHRTHASIVGLPRLLPSYAGLLLEEEVAALTKALSPVHPAFAVIGGSKFDTKEPVLHKLLALYDRVFVGGALANDFLKASGHEIGRSLVASERNPRVNDLLNNPKLMLPTDVRVVPIAMADRREDPTHIRIASANSVSTDEVILDEGPATIELLATVIARAKTVLWNGPLGHYENGFVQGTDALAQCIARSSARSVVGGGDTIASIEKLGILSKFSFVSTGGGAMLEFLANGTLPGIEALT